MLAASALAGCAGERADDGDANGGNDEGELEFTSRAVALTLDERGDDLTLDDEPRLASGARGKLTCASKFEGVAGLRYTCKRGSEKLELLLREREHTATLLYKNGSAKREAFACTLQGSALQCESKRASSSGGGLSSPFASTVPGVNIPNAHRIDGAPLLMRGMAPRSDAQYDELEAAGVKAVLIFKNATGNGSDVDDEKAELSSRGFTGTRLHHVPFKWKDIGSFREACEQTVDALRFLAARERARQKTFFHCTVGEDRTGLLAAMARLVRSPEQDPRTLFQNEMCERGYGSGNPQKPFTVTRELDEGLTPLFRKLAFLVRSGALTSDSLEDAACANDPQDDAAFRGDEVLAERAYACGTSTAYSP